MPIYEYECKKCKAHIEVLQKMSDKPLTKCRRCGGRLEKQWSATGFQFVGSGWYVTDYAGKKTEGREEKSSAKETSASGSSDKDSTAKESKAKDSKAAAPAKANSSSNTSGD